MTLRSISLDSIQSLVDVTYKMLPQKVPDHELLRKAKIVSHRGEYDNRNISENTLRAFKRALDSGVWGLEFDIRWTADLQPVVIHDRETSRVFNKNITIANVTFNYLRQRVPQIPTLEEVIKLFGHKMHLMVEIKKEPLLDSTQQSNILAELFSNLIPVNDYHFISLNPSVFDNINFVPSMALLTVSEMNTKRLSQMAYNRRYGGITGHYLLITDELIEKHHKINQKVGTGFIASKNALFREIHRGVDWIFSNQACRLQKIVDDCLRYGIK